MGKRGPAKQPVEDKIRAGTRQPHRDPLPPPVAYALPPCPFPDPTMPEAQSWALLMRVMTESKLDCILTSADTGTLEAAAISWCRARQASADAAALTPQNRYVHTKSNGLRPHPAIAEERLAWADFRRFAADLGLSPSARSSIGDAPAAAGGASSASDAFDMDALTRAMLNAGPMPVDD